MGDGSRGPWERQACTPAHMHMHTHAIHRQLATGQGRLLRRRGSWINNQAVEGSYSCLLACFLSSVLV